MTNKECYLYTNSFNSHHWKKFKCWFSFKNGSEKTFVTLFTWPSEKSEVFWSLWLIRIATSIQTVFTVIFGKFFRADFHLKTGVREIFLTRFKWSSEKSEVFSSLWLIRSATSIQTVFTVIIGKFFRADFHFKLRVRELFVTLFTWSSEKNEVSSSLWLIRSATSIQTVFTVIVGKIFSADFQLKTKWGNFSNSFLFVFWKSEIFSTLWLIRSATFVKTVFTVILGKNFSADFHLKTGVKGLFLTLLFGLLKRVKFFHPYD